MRVLVTGASGAIGRRLVVQLVAAGNEVIGHHNAAASAETLRELGAEPLQVDLLDEQAVRGAVLAAKPDAIVHQATAFAGVKLGRNIDAALTTTNALRTRGTAALLAAAREAGVRRFVAQSTAAFLRYAREGGFAKGEDDPLDPDPPSSFRQTAAALTQLERAVGDFGGTALRYGVFYGAADDGTIELVRRRRFPIIGNGAGVWSWIHLDDAAAATVLALEREGPALYNIVDDDPAPVSEWLPVLAETLGAKSPRRLPAGLARVLAGDALVAMSTEARGASNGRAKRELGWTPRYTSWRDGFQAAYGKSGSSDAMSS